MKKHFINLTNGIEFIPKIHDNYAFIRIQSTSCEQKRWDFILQELDNNLLMNLALGYECIIYDCGHKGTPRALWQGIQWIYYVLNKVWFDKDEIIIIKNQHNVTEYFKDVFYSQVSKLTIKKLQYFKKFLLTDKIKLSIISKQTKHDSQYEWYLEQLKNEKKGG